MVRLTHPRGDGEDAARFANRLDDLEARQRRQADLFTALLVIALSWPLLAPTAAAIDRLVRHSVILELNVSSYRLEHAKQGKSSPAADGTSEGE